MVWHPWRCAQYRNRWFSKSPSGYFHNEHLCQLHYRIWSILLFGLLALGISTRSGPSWMEPTEHMLVHSSRIPIYSVWIIRILCNSTVHMGCLHNNESRKKQHQFPLDCENHNSLLSIMPIKSAHTEWSVRRFRIQMRTVSFLMKSAVHSPIFSRTMKWPDFCSAPL